LAAHYFLKLRPDQCGFGTVMVEYAWLFFYSNMMNSPEMGSNPEHNRLADELSDRARMASEKVNQRVLNSVVPNIDRMGNDAEWWLSGLQNDFYTLVDDPEDPCGGGNYRGWTADEIRELYRVLYGEEMG